MRTTVNTTQNLIMNTLPSISSSASTDVTEGSILSKSNNCNNYTNYNNYHSRELPESSQQWQQQREKIKFWAYNSQINNSQVSNSPPSQPSPPLTPQQREDIEFWAYDTQQKQQQQQQQLYSMSRPPPSPPPPLEFDISSASGDHILSPDEFNSIFESFDAVADGISDYKIPFMDGINNDEEDDKILEALESFSL